MAVQSLNLTGALLTPKAVGMAFGATIVEHPEMPKDKVFFVDRYGNVVAVIVNIGKDGSNGG